MATAPPPPPPPPLWSSLRPPPSPLWPPSPARPPSRRGPRHVGRGDKWLHVFTTACDKAEVFSWATGLLSSIHAGLRMRHAAGDASGGDHLGKVHVHLIHDGSRPAQDLIRKMERAAAARFFKPVFRFSAAAPDLTTARVRSVPQLTGKTGNRPCGLSRLFVADWFPDVDSGLYIDADCIVLGDVRQIFHQHLSAFTEAQWAGMAWESERGHNYYRSRSPQTYFRPQGLNSGVLLLNLTVFIRATHTQ